MHYAVVVVAGLRQLAELALSVVGMAVVRLARLQVGLQIKVAVVAVHVIRQPQEVAARELLSSGWWSND